MADHSVKNLWYSLLVLGFSAMIVQIVVLRELMAYFQGNELILGLALGMWMLLTGLGARMSGWLRSPASLHLLLMLFSLLSVVMIPAGRYLLVTPGTMAGLDSIALVLLISLLPFCMVAGMLFPLLSDRLSQRPLPGILHTAYAIESSGSLIGGLLFSLVMVLLLTTWQSLTVVMLVNLLAAALFYLERQKKAQAYFLVGIMLALLAVSILFQPLLLFDRLYYKGQEVITRKDTPYGRLVVTRLQDQVNIYQNGIPLTQPDDVASREERVHYAMLIKPEAQHVLMLSGGTGGALEEVLKYPEATVDYVDVDPFLIKVAIEHGGLPQSPRINIIMQDPVRFAGQSTKRYDIILVNAPDPSSGLLNRMYTLSFFRNLKGLLKSDGVLQIALSGGANYLSIESLKMHSVTYNSLSREFKVIGLVPGNRNYFLAADTLPNKMLGEMYAEAGIENQYVNPYYLNELQMGQRSRKIMEQLDPGAGVNTDARPLGYYLQIQEWLRQFQVPTWFMPSLLVAILLVFLFTLGPLNLGLFAGGLTAASSEFMLLLWLQATYGYVYQLVGLIFTMFMAGLVLGSWFLPSLVRQFSYRTFLLFQLLMSGFVLVLTGYIFLSEMLALPGWASLVAIFGMTVVAGALTGLQYTSAVRIRKTAAMKNVALSYSADLAGSALGSMIVSVFLLPLAGMYLTGLGLAGFCLAVLAVLFFRRSG